MWGFRQVQFDVNDLMVGGCQFVYANPMLIPFECVYMCPVGGYVNVLLRITYIMRCGDQREGG